MARVLAGQWQSIVSGTALASGCRTAGVPTPPGIGQDAFVDQAQELRLTLAAGLETGNIPEPLQIPADHGF